MQKEHVQGPICAAFITAKADETEDVFARKAPSALFLAPFAFRPAPSRRPPWPPAALSVPFGAMRPRAWLVMYGFHAPPPATVRRRCRRALALATGLGDGEGLLLSRRAAPWLREEPRHTSCKALGKVKIGAFYSQKSVRRPLSCLLLFFISSYHHNIIYIFYFFYIYHHDGRKV